MSPVEKLQAAIDKLTQLSNDEQWIVVDGGNSGVTIGTARNGALIDAGDFAGSDASFISSDDAELIVTLHRTIDAQLAILRAARDLLRRGVVAGTPNDVALAESILGAGS